MSKTVGDTLLEKTPIFARPKAAPNGSGHGAPPEPPAGMDRKIKKKTWTPKKIALIAAVVAFVGFVTYGFATTTGGSRLNVDKEKITIVPVSEGPFQELINVTGSVMPRTTVYLDAVEGGRVEEVFVREGAMVKAGDPILRLSNNDLQLRLLQNEAAVSEQENLLQNMRFQIEQNMLNLRQQLTLLDYETIRLRRQHERNEELIKKKLISQQEYEQTLDELNYTLARRDLTRQTYRSDSLAQRSRLNGMQESVTRMRMNFGILQQTLANLTVKAPVNGHLTALQAEIGELRAPGSRFGQIDMLDGGYKVRAGVDEFYLSRVQPGQTGRTSPIGGKEYRMQIMRVYPEVRDGRFEVDLDFIGEAPPDIRRGQTIRFFLELSDPEQKVILPRGGFYQSTGGNWIYVVNDAGDAAEKRDIKIGRQNPGYYEVLEGLKPGDRVVTSSYETFGNPPADRLVLN